MSSLKVIWDCIFSPRLIKIYGSGPVEKFYEPQPFEKWGNQVIHSLYVIWKLGVYTSPFLVGILYQRGYFERDGLVTLTKLVTSMGVILVISYCIRGFGRAQNPTYIAFLDTLQKSQKKLVPTIKQDLNKYDFEFSAWPVEYDLSLERYDRRSLSIRKPILHENMFQFITTIPFRVIAYFAIHTFGIRLIYPGTLGFLQMIIGDALLQGRTKMVESFRGERFKLKTVDGNEIDSIFIDKRNASPNGNTLVICCEGNAGFYEIGIAITPIEAGFSVVGWNHPGFGGSTGQPYPNQEQNAMDAVMQFAINKLGFRLSNIIVFGWSIGGYTSSWAAMNYPEIKGVILDATFDEALPLAVSHMPSWVLAILDATFDDILPLAISHMPSWWEPIVKIAIREHVNLNIIEHLSKYSGPVLLIRRTEDEVICLNKNDLSSNRGNYLLIKLLRQRYPCIYDESQQQLLADYLSVTAASQDALLKKHNVDENVCLSLLQSYVSEFSKSYPMKIGEEFSNKEKTQMAIFLARKYMKDFKSTHCENLPAELFQVPWDVNVESDFVFT